VDKREQIQCALELPDLGLVARLVRVRTLSVFFGGFVAIYVQY
jgi:hypothetical protein